MGLLVDGVWQDTWYDTKSTGGKFVRKDAQFRNWVTADGSAGPSGKSGFKAEAGRYHLYISHACPWAHRTLIFRHLKGLEDLISLSVVDPDMMDKGWSFSDAPGTVPDTINGAKHMYEVYTRADPSFTGRVTVPVLWDKNQSTIASNESSEIIRMFNSAFDGLTGNNSDYYPQDLRQEIDAINDRIYNTVNNGVYKCGFATTQEAYETAFVELFDTLDVLEDRLSGQRYLAGDRVTEADWRLFTTLVRFDPVYFGHFKCNKRRIADYPNLSNYLRDLYQMPGIAGLTHMDHIKRHYYYSHESINPTRIVPLGPEIDLDAPHDRARFGA
ncbi:MAG: glutathione S-transferase family protein [Pseudomonadota bacterium]